MSANRTVRLAWTALSVTSTIVVADQTESLWWALLTIVAINFAVFLGGASVITDGDER